MEPRGSISGGRIDLSQVERLLADLGHKTSDLTEFFTRSVDPNVTEAFTKQFETEGQFLSGKRWAGIAPLTVQLRARPGHGFAGPKAILRDTDQMRRSLVHATNEGFRKIRPQEYERGILSPVAALHQTGWTSRSIFGRPRRRPVKVPARPIVPEEVPKSIVEQWLASYVRYLETPR